MPALAAVPSGSIVDPCCCPCALGKTLKVLFSGLVLCENCQVQGEDAAYSVKFTAFSLTGPYTLTGPATGPWVAASEGTWTALRYDDHNCAGVGVEYSGTFRIEITCSGDGELLVFAGTNTVAGFDDGFGIPLTASAFLGTGTLDTAIANLDDCLTFLTVTLGGTGTPALP